MPQPEPTIATILRQLANEYNGPVDEREVLEVVLARRPSSAKKPFATIRDRLRWDGLSLGWLRLSRQELMPLRVALDGLRFRCLPRTLDIERGTLPIAHLQPFAGIRIGEALLIDRQQTPLRPIESPDQRGRQRYRVGYELREWYARHRFAPGDSILATVIASEPLTIAIEHEPAAAFRRETVAAQDSALLRAMLERFQREPSDLVPCDELILPIFAAAAWRTAYPGTPWQQLLLRDGRLRLIDDLFITSHGVLRTPIFNSDGIFSADPPSYPPDEALISAIEGLQQRLRQARQRDSEAGLWSGQVRRASPLSLSEHFGEQSFGHIFLDDADFDDLHASLGLEDLDFDDDEDERLDFDEFPPLVIDRNVPLTFDELRRRIIHALPPEAVYELEHGDPAQSELVIARYLSTLLFSDPGLFPRIDLSTPYNPATAFGWQPFEEAGEADQEDEAFAPVLPNDEDDDLFLNGDSEDDEDLIDLDETDYREALAQSQALINQFYDYLCETGKRASTARQRARQVTPFADFLDRYYQRDLRTATYATLDEWLFFYYPRRVPNASARQLRETCTAIKQFYAFLEQRGSQSDHRFAEALWRRREQAVEVLELYQQVTREAHEFERLTALLFEPYSL